MQACEKRLVEFRDVSPEGIVSIGYRWDSTPQAKVFTHDVCTHATMSRHPGGVQCVACGFVILDSDT